MLFSAWKKNIGLAFLGLLWRCNVIILFFEIYCSFALCDVIIELTGKCGEIDAIKYCILQALTSLTSGRILVQSKERSYS